MQNTSRYRSPQSKFTPHSLFAAEATDGESNSTDPLPNVPILLATRLRLEQLLQTPALNLREISEVILSDLGATLQMLRLIGEEYLAGDERPIRMEDCVASLNSEVWFPAVCSATLAGDSRTLEAWEHARRIARHAEQLGAQEEFVRPGEAQLVGLLHEVGRLPELLGWQEAVDGMEDITLGILLAEHWQLPGCVAEAVRGEGAPGDRAQWAALLKSAHLRDQQEEESRQRSCGELLSAAGQPIHPDILPPDDTRLSPDAGKC